MYGLSNIHSVDAAKMTTAIELGQSEAVGWGAALRNPLASGVAECCPTPGRGGMATLV